MYNPTDRLERVLGTQSDQRPPSSTSPEFQSVTTNRTGVAEPNLSWRTSGFVLPSFLGPRGSGAAPGRGGTATVCSWGWNTLLLQGKRSVTTLGTCWGKAWGSGKEFPGCRHLAECSLWLRGLLDVPFWPRAHPGEGDVI